jgi:DNA-binding NarL/FixJ family response regulator
MTTAPESSALARPPAVGESVRVFLVADVRVYRELLVDALPTKSGIDVAGSTPTDIAGMAIGMTDPAVVLVDASANAGVERVHAIAAAAPAAKIVAVGIPDDEAVLVELVEAGVTGYVTAEQPLGELVEVVEAAAHGELRCSPRVAAALAEHVAALKSGATPDGSDYGLTRREREVAAHIAQDLSNKQIASRLSIERATVKNHVHNILSKLGVSHRDEVAAFVRTSLLMLLSAASAASLLGL